MATTKTLRSRKKAEASASRVETANRIAAHSELSKVDAPTRLSTKRNRVAKTFESKVLEASFVHFCQLTFPDAIDEQTSQAAARQILQTEIQFIGGDVFRANDVEQQLFGNDELIPAPAVETISQRKGKTLDLPPHLARLCEAKLLTPDEEKLIFHRMNYLKFRAFQLRCTLSLDAVDNWTVRRIKALLNAADWYRDRMVKSNMRLVISIVKKFVNKQNSFDDLLSEGIVALLKAVEKFDVALGFRFSTYATQVVRRNTYRKVMEKQSERQRITLSVHDAGVDIAEDDRSSSMSEGRWHELRSKLSSMLDSLDRREKLIVRARFSLGSHRRVQTLQRLADLLGVSKERIRQIEKRALDKLRTMVEAVPLDESAT